MGKFREWLKKPGRGKKLALPSTIGIVLVFVIAVLGLSAQYTSQPSFCPTCHYMEPYYESWIAAPAHSEVSCVKCHFPPGVAGTVRGKMEGLMQVVNYLGRSYTRRTPWAEIDDLSCLQSGCHETRLLGDTLLSFKGVAFSHDAHLTELRRGKQLRCTSCHSQIVQGDHIKVTETTCFLCHFKQSPEVEPELYEQLADCKTCHRWDADTTTAPTSMAAYHVDLIDRGLTCNQCHSKTVVGDGFVPRESCFGCHGDPERLDKYGETTLLHENHIANNKIECVQCHLQIQHKIQSVADQQDLECGTCHRETHREQLMLFTGRVNGDDVEPSPMFTAGLDCAGCHVFHDEIVAAEEQTAQPQSCENCHGAGYNRLLGLWRESANKNMVDFGRTIRRVEQAVSGSARKERAESSLDNAKKVLHVVQVGKPVHNVTFYDHLVRAGYGYLQSAIDSAGARLDLPEFKSTDLVPGRCANCHTGVERITTLFRGSEFPHERHVGNLRLDCSSCHSNAVRHGQVILDQQQCNACHHQEVPEQTCESCHREAQQVYAGTYLAHGTADLMFDEEVTCVDCHMPGQEVTRPTMAVCLDCHDEGYDEEGTAWMAEVATLTAEVRGLMGSVPRNARSHPDYQRAGKVLSDFDRGAAGGAHNYVLTSEVLIDVKDRLERLVNTE